MWTSGRDSGHPLWWRERPTWRGCCRPPLAPCSLLEFGSGCSAACFCHDCAGMWCPPAVHIWGRWACPHQVILYLPSRPWSLWLAKKIGHWKKVMEQEYRTHKKTQQNNEMSELIALGAPFPAVVGVPSYLCLTVFYSHHKDKWHRLCCSAWTHPGAWQSHTLWSSSQETALSAERSPSEQSPRMSPVETPEAKQQKNTPC